jgi:UDP:flavonoid glycosyltransferase YjiC (YdhE family)
MLSRMSSQKKAFCAASSGYGHVIPALGLALQLRALNTQTTMLLPPDVSIEDFVCDHDVRIASLTKKFLSERAMEVKELLEAHQPDITICDFSLELWWALRGWRPRCSVSILRCELIRGYERRNPLLSDKFMLENEDIVGQLNAGLSSLGLKTVANAHELYGADIIVIPSIPQIDVLSDRVHEYYPDTTFVYSGPLLTASTRQVPDSLKEWLAARHRQGVPILLVTFGTFWGANLYKAFAECLRRIDIAVLMIVSQEKERKSLEHYNGDRFQVTGFTNFRELVDGADLVLHHCGHGTLHTVLLAGKPSLTLGSGEYDREDNAIRLEELGCGKHLGSDFFRHGFDSKTMESAIRSVLSDSEIHAGVKRIAEIERKYTQEGPAEFTRALAGRGL